jgi:hypothetical protein
MNINPYFSTRPKACPHSPHDIEMLLLKFTLKEALFLRKCVSYDQRLFLYLDQETTDSESPVMYLTRASEPDIAVALRIENLAQAVDKFVDSFIYETSMDLDKVHIHTTAAPISAAIPWPAFRRLPTKTLLSTTNVKDFIDATNEFAAASG